MRISPSMREATLLAADSLPPQPPMTWRDAIRNIIFGAHSNIPFCCIRFFVKDWWINSVPGYKRAYWEKMLQAEEEGYDFQYIPCPNCLEERSFNVLHKCKSELCKNFHQSLEILRG